jgi:hypothetical protein
MPDNLTVEISANSGKFRAELTLLQKQLRDLRKDLSAAANAGDTAEVNRLSLSYEKLAAQIRGTNRALSEQNRVVAASKTNWSEMAIGVKEAVAAFAAMAGVRKVAGIFGEVADKITEISNTAKAAALSPGDVQVFQEVIEDTGESAEGARQALVNLTDQLAQTRIKSKGFGQDLATGVNVMRGSIGDAVDGVKTLRGSTGGELFGVEVNRGGKAAAKSVEELTEKIKENAIQFKTNRERIQSVFEQLGQLRKRDAELGTAVGVQILGRRYAIFAEAIDRLAKGASWEEVRQKLIEQKRYIDEDASALGKQYKAAVDDLTDSFEKLKFAIAIPLFPNVTGGITKLAELVENVDKLIAKYKEFRDLSGLAAIEDNIAGPIRRGITSALDALRQFGLDIPGPIGASFTVLADLIKVSVDLITGDLSGALRDFKTLSSDVWTAVTGLVTGFGDGIKGAIGLVGDLITWVGNLASKIASLPSSLFSGAGTAAPTVPGAVYAAGGMVRGPGTGTSDSILGRLSNGEFVMRTAAVRHWGPQLLSAMNALNRPLRGVGDGSGFANGGLVSAKTSDGATVNLHFPGGSFSLRGDKAIVEGLTREARRAAVLSAGRSPGAALA